MFDEGAFSEMITGVSRFTDELQRAFDDVAANSQGKPVESVKLALQARVGQIEGIKPLVDPELTEWAEAISAGNRVNVTYRAA